MTNGSSALSNLFREEVSGEKEGAALNLLCLMWSSKRKFTRDEIFRQMAPYRSYANSDTARRTFERDKAALRQVGFDIRTDHLRTDPPPTHWRNPTTPWERGISPTPNGWRWRFR